MSKVETALKELIIYNGRIYTHNIGIQMKRKKLTKIFMTTSNLSLGLYKHISALQGLQLHRVKGPQFNLQGGGGK